jgi:hypothetical protein
MSNFSNSWLNALDVDHKDKVFNALALDELDLPAGASIVTKGNSTVVRFTDSFGNYRDYPVVMRGMSKSDAYRNKHNLIDTAGLYGYSYKHGEPLEVATTDEQKRSQYVVGEWVCAVTKKCHITSRSIADQETRGPINLAQGTMTWDCDGEHAGVYRILAYGVNEQEGNQLKTTRYEQNLALGYSKCPRRDMVPHFEMMRKNAVIRAVNMKEFV